MRSRPTPGSSRPPSPQPTGQAMGTADAVTNPHRPAHRRHNTRPSVGFPGRIRLVLPHDAMHIARLKSFWARAFLSR
jgi:hypothetical protein